MLLMSNIQPPIAESKN